MAHNGWFCATARGEAGLFVRLKHRKHRKTQCLIWGTVSAASNPSYILLSLNFHGSCLWNGLSECNSRFQLMSLLWSECNPIHRLVILPVPIMPKTQPGKKHEPLVVENVCQEVYLRLLLYKNVAKGSICTQSVAKLPLPCFVFMFPLLITLLIPPRPRFSCPHLFSMTSCTRGRSSMTFGNKKPG